MFFKAQGFEEVQDLDLMHLDGRLLEKHWLLKKDDQYVVLDLLGEGYGLVFKMKNGSAYIPKYKGYRKVKRVIRDRVFRNKKHTRFDLIYLQSYYDGFIHYWRNMGPYYSSKVHWFYTKKERESMHNIKWIEVKKT